MIDEEGIPRMMRTRVAGSVLVLGLVGLGVAACGSTSSTSSGGTTTTTTTSTTAATTATSAVAGGSAASTCNQAVQVLQSLGRQVQTAGGNDQAIVQAVKSAVPQLRSAASQATGNGKTILDNLANSLQSIGNGSTGPAVATQITNAVSQLVGACS